MQAIVKHYLIFHGFDFCFFFNGKNWLIIDNGTQLLSVNALILDKLLTLSVGLRPNRLQLPHLQPRIFLFDNLHQQVMNFIDFHGVQ